MSMSPSMGTLSLAFAQFVYPETYKRKDAHQFKIVISDSGKGSEVESAMFQWQTPRCTAYRTAVDATPPGLPRESIML